MDIDIPNFTIKGSRDEVQESALAGHHDRVIIHWIASVFILMTAQQYLALQPSFLSFSKINFIIM